MLLSSYFNTNFIKVNNLAFKLITKYNNNNNK